MFSQEKIIKEFVDADAIKKGHFILSSGKHSDTYIQCALLLKDTQRATRICSMLVQKIQQNIDCQSIDLVISPALGGIIVGYEIARLLKKNSIFCERFNNILTLRRNFEITAGMKLLLVDDVFTTGTSSMEILEYIKNFDAEIVAQAVLVNRGKANPMPFPLIPLIEIEYSLYDSSNLPKNLADIAPKKLGSRDANKCQ